MDTSGEGVKLSCCEHYENVLFAYTDNEITAVNNFNAILFLPTPISLSHLLVLLIDCELFVPAFSHFIVYSDRFALVLRSLAVVTDTSKTVEEVIIRVKMYEKRLHFLCVTKLSNTSLQFPR